MEEDLSHLSRNQRRKLRKQQRREQIDAERNTRKRKKNLKKIITFAAIILIIALYISYRSYRLKDAPLAVITPSSYDFGVVSQAKGTVSTYMTIENKGKSNLVINNMESNCGCTTASIIFNDIEGPVFGMHNNPRDWSISIEPRQKAELKINYDPNVHKELRGSVARMVALYTNDPRNKKVIVRIDAYQTD